MSKEAPAADIQLRIKIKNSLPTMVCPIRYKLTVNSRDKTALKCFNMKVSDLAKELQVI